MKKIILLSALLSGCAAYPDYSALQKDYNKPENNPYLKAMYNTVVVSPSVAPDGSKSFTAVGYNTMPSYSSPGETLKQAHMRMIATELARQKLCMNGYSFTDTRATENNTVYLGVCK